MSAAASMKDLLRPLGVYRLENSYLEAELESVGAAMDEAQEYLEVIQREMSLATAQDSGLEAIASLLPRRPVAETPQQLAAALAALLRIGGDSFTTDAVSDTAAGCGLGVSLTEPDEPETVEVQFRNVRGIPEGFDEIARIVQDILPAHVEIAYKFLFQTWARLNARRLAWSELHRRGVTWDELEKMV